MQVGQLSTRKAPIIDLGPPSRYVLMTLGRDHIARARIDNLVAQSKFRVRWTTSTPFRGTALVLEAINPHDALDILATLLKDEQISSMTFPLAAASGYKTPLFSPRTLCVDDSTLPRSATLKGYSLASYVKAVSSSRTYRSHMNAAYTVTRSYWSLWASSSDRLDSMDVFLVFLKGNKRRYLRYQFVSSELVSEEALRELPSLKTQREK